MSLEGDRNGGEAGSSYTSPAVLELCRLDWSGAHRHSPASVSQSFGIKGRSTTAWPYRVFEVSLELFLMAL